MKTIAESSIETLSELVEVCNDGQEGFQTAARDAKDPELSRALTQFAVQRTRCLNELQLHIRTLGGLPRQRRSVQGTIHRGWINLKSTLSADEPHAVLAECERGEDFAVKSYREALARDIDSGTRRLLQKQYEEIQAARDEVAALRASPLYALRAQRGGSDLNHRFDPAS